MKNLHLLPTTQNSWLCLKDGELVNANDGGCMLGYDPPRWLTQHIYITSEGEIKEGDWHISSDGWCIDKTFNEDLKVVNEKMNGYRKIILTTDQDLISDGVQAIPDEFLEWFVNNPSCEYVEVELIDTFKKTNEVYVDEITSGNYYEIIKKYKIIIPKEPKQENCCTPIGQIKRYIDCKGCDRKLKQETLKEAAERNCESITHPYCDREKAMFIKGVKWQQEQDKKLYSEEEVLVLLHKRDKHSMDNPDTFNGWLTPKEWFEQFKKK